MAEESGKSATGNPMMSITRNADGLLAFGIVGILVLMIIPIPTALLSLLLVLNISISVIILLVSMYIQNALEFSTFPSLLLMLTIFRLSLNIASTKLILLQADAGDIITAFGQVVVRGNAVVGFIVFIILVIVQFIVITKGAERISEVGARFILDAMPGKQMGIDADLNAGLIGDKEAQHRREVIRQEADFYGAMDGASKFVRGDAIASIIIVAINIVGGIIIGFMQGKMEWMDVLKTYTILTIGDGLVTQIPALFISTASAVIVTRAVSRGDNLGSDIAGQIFSYPKALKIAAGTLVLFGIGGLFTGLPSIPFLAIAGIMGVIVYSLKQQKAAEQQAAVVLAKKEAAVQDVPRVPEDVTPLLAVDTLELEIGYSLIHLADKAHGGELLDRITMVRRQCTQELGLAVPPVRIRDNVTLPLSNYVVKIKGIQVARGEVMVNHYLAINPGRETVPLNGIATTDPAFGLPAYWINDAQRGEAEMHDYTIIDSASVIVTHLTEVIRSHAHELLGRQDVQVLISTIKEKGYSAVVDELVPALLNIGGIQKVLQNLLRERVAIRDLVTILETLADQASFTKDTEVLTEYVRHSLARQISKQYQADDDTLCAMTMDPRLEKFLSDAVQRTDRGAYISMDPTVARKLFDSISEKAEKAASGNYQPLVICSAGIRLYFKKFIEQFVPNLVVLSYSEIVPSIKVKPIGMISMEQ